MTSSRPASRSAAALRWAGVGLVVAALHALWSLAVPLMASPDEPSHAVRAAAVARGQWSGELGPAASDASRPGAATTVRLPSDWIQVVLLPNCLAFDSSQPASCQQPVAPPDGSLQPVDTYAGQYPPLYYALVGWPSRFLHAEASVYAMRLLSGAIAAAFLVWGFARLRSTTSASAAIWGALAAVTPTVVFMGASVNPQGLEIASAFAFWAACLALVTGSAPPSRGLVLQVGVAGAVLVNSRSSGPVWALLAVAVSLLLADRSRLQQLVASHRLRWAGGAGLAAGGLAAWWIVTHGDVVSGRGLYPQYANPVAAARVLLGFTNAYLHQMIGEFGWLDAPAPPVTTLLWFVAIGSLLLVSLAIRGRIRGSLTIVVASLAVFAAPFVLQIPTAVDAGIIWQGRYALPAAVGVPMVASAVLSRAPAAVVETTRVMTGWIVGGLAVAHVSAFLWASRRYSEGLDGELLTGRPEWSSPIGYLSGVGIYTLVVALLSWLAWRDLRTESSPQTAPSRALVTEAGH